MADIFVNAIMRQKTELDLMKQRNFGQQIMVTMGQGVTVTTVEGVFEYVNPAYASMLGYPQEAVIGKTVLEFTFPENESTLIQAQMRRLEGKTSSYETRLRKADGTPLYVLINGVPHYDHQGKIIGSIATITDLTERREAEALIEANAAEVKAIYQAAVQLFKPSNVRELAKQMVNYLNAAHLFVLCSFSEGSPNVVKEAMALNCPLVVTNAGDAAWVVSDTPGCYVSPSYEPEDFATKLRLALQFAEQNGRTKGRERLLTLGLDSKSIAGKVIAIYGQVQKKSVAKNLKHQKAELDNY